jgi:hypothetical protein
MDEAEWLACAHPDGMLEFVKRTATNRQSRLFACACCRRIWSLIDPPSFREAVEIAEQYGDGLVIGKVRKSLAKRLGASYRQSWGRPEARRSAAHAALHCLQKDTGWHPASHYSAVRAVCALAAEGDRERVGEMEYAEQADLLRDIFGNPFRPVNFSPEWRTDTALTLARQMYESRDFTAMPILADALQDAGCDSEDVLSHCRGTGPHVRGCWVVDLVLDKE